MARWKNRSYKESSFVHLEICHSKSVSKGTPCERLINPWVADLYTVSIVWYRWCRLNIKVQPLSKGTWIFQPVSRPSSWLKVNDTFVTSITCRYLWPTSQRGFQVIGGSLLQTSNSHCCMKALHIMLKLLSNKLILKQTTSSHDKNVSMVSKSFWHMTAPFGLKIIEGNHCRFCEKRIAWLHCRTPLLHLANPLYAIDIGHIQKWEIIPPLCH